MMKELQVTFRIVTPLFLAGANQQQAELRLPSLKGALRFWYRAVDPEYRKWEGKIFGSTDPGEGQSRFLMRSSSIKWKSIPYSENRFKGIKYLGFSFILGQKEQGKIKKRSHLIENKKFTVSFMLRPFKEKEDKKTEEPLQYWRRLMASLWLLGHIGGLGSRSRRGFGTLALEHWDGGGIPEVEQIRKELPIANREADIEKWENAFSQGIKVIQSWFGNFPPPDHSVIDSESSFFLFPKGLTSWIEAMEKLGGTKEEKYGVREEGVLKKYRIENRKKNYRLVLGLPMISKKEYRPKDRDRMASPVWLRIVNVGGNYYPFISILSTTLPIIEEEYKERGRIKKKRIDLDHKAALQKFRHHLKGWREIQ